MKIGSAKYQGEFKKRTFAKLKDGEQAFRILPPLGDLADRGVWSVFWNVHYGYTNSAGKLRTFASPLVKNNRTRMIEVPDAALERIEKLKAQLESAKAQGNQEMVSRLTALVSGQKPKFNMDKNHYMNAVDASGNIVILQLRHRAKQALDAEIKALRDKGVDPLSVDNGRYFVFRRTGMGLETNFKVSIMQETMNVPNVGEVKRDVVHKLDSGLIARLQGEAGELNKLFKTPSSEEVAAIVKEGAPAVDRILDAKASPASVDADDADLDQVDPIPAEVAQPVAQPAAQPAAAPVAKVAPQAVVPTMTDDEFLASVGLN